MAAALAVGLHEEDRRGCGRRLAPHLRRAAPVLRAHRSAVRGLGPGRRPGLPRRRRPPLPPLPIGPGALRVARAHARLGWHWWPAANAILSAPWSGRHPCVQRATCMLGCNEGAKGSTDLTHWPAFVAAGGRLITGACVVADPDRCARARHRRRMGRRGGSARTSKRPTSCSWRPTGSAPPASCSRRPRPARPTAWPTPRGSSDTRLMVHPLALVKGLFREDLESWRGHAGGSIVSYQFYASDERRGFVGGAKWAMAPTGGPLRAALANGGRVGRGAPPPCARSVRVRARTGDWCARTCPTRRIASTFRRPSPTVPVWPRHGSPTASTTTPGPCVNGTLSKARESLVEAGAWHTEVEFRYPPNGHFMGTARMGDDPDAFGRRPLVHGP